MGPDGATGPGWSVAGPVVGEAAGGVDGVGSGAAGGGVVGGGAGWGTSVPATSACAAGTAAPTVLRTATVPSIAADRLRNGPGNRSVGRPRTSRAARRYASASTTARKPAHISQPITAA